MDYRRAEQQSSMARGKFFICDYYVNACSCALWRALQVAAFVCYLRDMDDEPWEGLVIYLLKLVIRHNQQAHGWNMGIIYDIMLKWMKCVTNFDNPYAIG